MIWLLLASLFFLSLVVFSDIKSRQIPIIYLLGETIVSVWLGYDFIGISIMKSTIINFAVITFQILILFGWNKIREGRSGNFWAKFGKGDLFMLAITAINLSALNLLLFIVLVSLTSLIIWIGLTSLLKMKDKTIPFAGFLALGLMLLRILQLTGNGTNIYFDNYLLNIIYGLY